MTSEEEALGTALFHRWRVRLAVVVALLVPTAAVSLLLALVHDGPLVVPALLAAGAGCVVRAWRSVPRSLTASERPTMARSAAWAGLGLVLFVVVPVALTRAGVLGG